MIAGTTHLLFLAAGWGAGESPLAPADVVYMERLAGSSDIDGPRGRIEYEVSSAYVRLLRGGRLVCAGWVTEPEQALALAEYHRAAGARVEAIGSRAKTCALCKGPRHVDSQC